MVVRVHDGLCGIALRKRLGGTLAVDVVLGTGVGGEVRALCIVLRENAAKG